MLIYDKYMYSFNTKIVTEVATVVRPSKNAGACGEDHSKNGGEANVA
jgi:hypothetical protein